MSTDIKPELSKKNKYWIEKHRYYELKHFCMQYRIWVDARLHIRRFSTGSLIKISHDKNDESILEKAMNQVLYYTERIDMVEKCAKETNEELSKALILGVSTGMTFEKIRLLTKINCSRDEYYENYRKFFYILNKYHY